MHQPPSHLVIRYLAYIAKQGIASADVGEYQKWLRFFLDFSEKYQISGEASQRVSSFLNKLREKHQSEEQMRRAFQAVSLYFEMIKLEQVPPQVNSSLQPPQPAQESHTAPSEIVKSPLNIVRTSHYSEAGYQEKTD